jgi:hypothetical protein
VEGEEIVRLSDLLAVLRPASRGMRMDLCEGNATLEDVLGEVRRHRFDEERLWFSGRLEELGQSGFERLAEAFPHAIVQCPVDFLAPLFVAAPDRARDIVEMLAHWGINRFSVSWRSAERLAIADRLEEWDCRVDITDVPDLEGFLRAVLLLPTSIASRFDFPEWRGRSEINRREALSSDLG